MKKTVTFFSNTPSFRKAMKLSVTVFLGLMLVVLAATVNGRPKTYLVETKDDTDTLVTLKKI